MLNIQSASMVINLITFFLAYLVAVTVSGAFRAWVAKKVGDPTAESLGFLTLNPIAHIDPLGLAVLFIFYFGWGRYVPINPLFIHYPHRGLKLAAAYFADVFAHLVMAILGIFILVIAFGKQVLFTTTTMLLGLRMSHLYIAGAHPDSSSLMVSVAFVVVAAVYLNVVLGVLYFIRNASSLAMIAIAEHSSDTQEYATFGLFILPFIIIWFFFQPLLVFTVNLISIAGYLMAALLGIA
jgi:hypothetical protein